jgi:4-oxalocrotonate tautomerase
MPIVTVQQSPRDVEQKRLLVSRITDAFVDAYGVEPEQVQVFIHEVADTNWGKAGMLALPAEKSA